MRRSLLTSVTVTLLFSAVSAASHGDVMTLIGQFIYGLNTGDTNSVFAAHAPGEFRSLTSSRLTAGMGLTQHTTGSQPITVYA